MGAEAERNWSIEEYLAFDRKAETRHEYFDGRVVAMAGSSREHNLITTNVVAALHPQLRGGDCEIYSSDMRVRIPATKRYTYPDVVIVCGGPEFADEDMDTLFNPTLLIEVLSPSTEGHDWRKFSNFRTVPSLGAYLLVAQDRVHVERFTPHGDGRWILAEASGPETTLDLPEIGCKLTLADIYEGVPGLE